MLAWQVLGAWLPVQDTTERMISGGRGAVALLQGEDSASLHLVLHRLLQVECPTLSPMRVRGPTNS